MLDLALSWSSFGFALELVLTSSTECDISFLFY